MEKLIKKNRLNIDVDSLMGYVFKLWMRGKKQILDKFGLTIAQYEILTAIIRLSDLKKRIIQIDLSEETGIDPMTVSTILRNMEKHEWITRVRGTINTRVIYIKLTPKGKSLYELASSKMLFCYDILYQNIDKDSLTAQLLVLSNELNKLKN